VRVLLEGVRPGEPCELLLGGEPAPFQYTGEQGERGAVVMLELGFEADRPRELTVRPATNQPTDLSRQKLALDGATTIGHEPATVTLSADVESETALRGPILGFAGHSLGSRIEADLAFQSPTLERTNDGPLFTDYTFTLQFADEGVYRLDMRCYRHRSWVAVAERFTLGMNARWVWTLNPEDRLDSILTHRGPEFESEKQPSIEPLAAERSGGVLGRLQMPVLNEYFVPNNLGWFSLFDSAGEESGLLGVVGLYGDQWREPVANMPELRVAEGRAEWHASLVSGQRHWMLYQAPVEREHTLESRLTPHRIHAEFNVLPLEAHMELSGERCYDASSWRQPGLFEAGDFHAAAHQRTDAIEPLQRAWSEMNQGEGVSDSAFDYLMTPGRDPAKAMYDRLLRRFQRWVRQFQGYREGRPDYDKNTLGFARHLRQLLIAYELLRRDGALTEQQIGRLNSYFVFAGKRIADEGRWPTSRTWLHPDHPESVRDFYAYGGEHKPDRLVWTNNLPNFQSDPMCALAHLSALFPEYPEAERWQRMAIEDIERQLSAYSGESGAWEEAINYALATLSYLLVTFRVLKHRLGINYFQDERVRRLIGWLCRFFGPYDPRFGVHTWPGIGNAILPVLGSDLLLAYAGELSDQDPLRRHCIAVYQKQADRARVSQRDLCLVAAMAPLPEGAYELPPLTSEHMDELGVAMRDRHNKPDESYLFQKIGFWKDHYEQDESAFNWYAKGAPLCMEYGTYAQDAALGASHNLVEIPDMDPLRRGYLADHMLCPALDYTHCEIPITLKLMWGRVRSFEEIDGNDAKQNRERTPYHYIGDQNPVGPKAWKVRKLLFVKPDYVVLFDRVYGDVPHRYNLHVTADQLKRQGACVHASGRFDLDLLAYIQHPIKPTFEQGELTPSIRGKDDPQEAAKHRQSYFRLYNHEDGIYRTLLFAKEREREVHISTVGEHGIQVVTPEYMDYVFVHEQPIQVKTDDIQFEGHTGWIRRENNGTVRAVMLDGQRLEAFGYCFAGRGPWTYNIEQSDAFTIKNGPPRRITVHRTESRNREQ